MDPAIGCITARKGSRYICCCVVVTSPPNPRTSGRPKSTGKITSGGINMACNVRATHNEHLRDPEIAAGYLSEALEHGDAAVILMALRNIAEAQEDGISGLAQRSHLGRESMYKMLSASGNPKLSSFTKVVHGLGLKLKVETDLTHHYR
jgi:probable addiction module antidote protein